MLEIGFCSKRYILAYNNYVVRKFTHSDAAIYSKVVLIVFLSYLVSDDMDKFVLSFVLFILKWFSFLFYFYLPMIIKPSKTVVTHRQNAY